MFKLIIIGSTGVGKSCLMRRVMNDDFKQEHQVTIGVEFGSYGIKVDNKLLKIQIWDTAGQESYKSVTRVFYRGAHFVFLTFDITREETFQDINDWLQEVKNHASEDVRIYLVGNKCELEQQREVSFERALEFGKQNGIHKVFETSAKTGDVVEVLFGRFVDRVAAIIPAVADPIRVEDAEPACVRELCGPGSSVITPKHTQTRSR